MRWYAVGSPGGLTVDTAASSDSLLAFNVYKEPCV